MNEASGGDEIPAELLQVLKYDAVKVLHSICQQSWKIQQWPQDWKRSVFIPIPKRTMPKTVQTFTQFHSFDMLARSCSKSKLGFNSTWTENFQIYKLDLEKAEEPEIKLSTFVGSWIKQQNYRKTSTSASLTSLNICVGMHAKSLQSCLTLSQAHEL